MPITKRHVHDTVNTLGYKLALRNRLWLQQTWLRLSKGLIILAKTNKTKPVCKTTIYWATKHDQMKKKQTLLALKWPESKEKWNSSIKTYLHGFETTNTSLESDL